MNSPKPPTPASATRRDFLKQTSTALAGLSLAHGLAARSYAAEENTIKIALVGCGGRGTGAAANALSTAGPDAAGRHGRRLREPAGGQPEEPVEAVRRARSTCRQDRQFLGLDGYKKAIDADRSRAASSCWPRRPASGRSTWSTRSPRAATCSWRNRSPSTPRASAAC